MPEIAAAPSPPASGRRRPLLRRLHALSGVIPVGGFLVLHLWINASALQGQGRYDAVAAWIARIPFLPLLDIALIILPLAFHAVYGVVLALGVAHDAGRHPYPQRWMYTMQRVTGILALLFIGFHLYEYWLARWLGRMSPDQYYTALSAGLSSTYGPVPVIGLIYFFGVTACVVHFAHGLWGFCLSWGITVSRRAQTAAAWTFGLGGLALFLLGARTVIYFATGARVP